MSCSAHRSAGTAQGNIWPRCATNRLIGEAESNGQERVVEMNKQVATNLENIISAIQDPEEDADAGDADAS